MASLISSFFSNKEKKHEVFLSFRGEDTRKTFVSHLCAALQRANINTYIDNLERWDEISETLLKAIEDSLISVIVFSENFATSKWCLDEVKKIMKCKKKKGQIVVPIFYHIEPTHVRNQTGTYASAFAEHERQFWYNPIKTKKWRDALKNAAGLAGEKFSVGTGRLESIAVEKIVMDLLKKLNHVYASDIDEKIEKYQQQAKCQKQYYDATPCPTYWRNYQEAVENIRKLQLGREERLRQTRQTPITQFYKGFYKM